MSSKKHRKLGVIACSAIVAGNMMGSGIALLPSTLAHIGSVTVFSWVIAIIGALSLAYVYAKLATFNPQAGGPIAYAEEVAPILGYQTALLYFHANWIGNLGIAVAGVDYLSVFYQPLTQPFYNGIAAIIVTWIFAFINMFGAKWIGRLTTIGVILLLIPVILTGTVGWFFFSGHTFAMNWNVTNNNALHASLSGVVLCLWSFIGLESASTDASLTEDPKKTIPRSTMIGACVAAIVYLASSTAIMGFFPAQKLANSGAPFSLAASYMFGHWSSWVVSIVTAFACLTSLGSWMMLVSQAGARSANDGILPKYFAKLNRFEVPFGGMISTALYMTILMIVLMFFASNAQMIFGYIASIAVLLTILPYYYSVLNYFHVLEVDQKAKYSLRILACILAALFCYAAYAGAEAVILIASTIVCLLPMLFYERQDRKKFISKIKKGSKL